MDKEAIIVPINGHMVPFHVSMIKNMTQPDPDLRINFYIPGSALGKEVRFTHGIEFVTVFLYIKCMYVCMYVLSLCTYVCMYVCMHVCINQTNRYISTIFIE